MLRRTLTLAFALTALATPVVADTTLQRDSLLTPAGTLYVLESEFTHKIEAEIDTHSERVLRLVRQENGEITTEFVPASLQGGWHSNPTLTYDIETDTLIAFWQYSESIVSSELLIATYRDGAWSEPAQINTAAWRSRDNFRIATTHWVAETDEEGQTSRVPSLTVHAIYWEARGDGEAARYAMISFLDGHVVDVVERDLAEWISPEAPADPVILPDGYDVEVFRHPAIVESANRESVDVIFADFDKARLHRITVRPIRQNGVLTVPDGIWRGDIMPPRGGMIQGTSTSVETVVNGSTIALYTLSDEELRYSLLSNGEWKEVRSIKPNAVTSLDSAVGALHRLVASARETPVRAIE